MSAEQATALELVSTSDLQDELLKRFDHAIFSGMILRSPGDGVPPDRITSWRRKGDEYVCMGLATHVTNSIHLALLDGTDTLDKEDL